MGNANVAVNTWLSSKERFADLFNGVLFGGRRVILPEELENVDRETDLLVTDKTGRRRALQRYRDTAMAWKREVILAILTCESQNKIHYAMPVREMMNDSLTYADQIRELWRKYERKERLQKEQKENTKVTRVRKDRHLTAEEYLSRFRKDDRLFPVISLVFYFDQKQWDGAKDLYDMFHISDELKKENILEKYFPNYHINFLDAGNVEDTKIDMCKALEDWYKDGVKEGERRGERRGEKRGEERGIKMGKILLIKNMRKNGMSDEDIRKYTGVSEAEMAAAKG
ncbi:MAG TPA: Rpn family recombination-promoting nuclease/putative transposase [Candidatus Mediterraneibacter stercoripullorum]|nr:Rpn family recombination-promoting nuclease/putative transposase [Candidatus Mediterraneibacter stercoripullorum]